MIKYLLKNTAEIFVDTEDDANALHKEYEEYARNNDYILSAWSQTYHTKKEKGEIVKEWWVCKCTLIFNDSKEPDIPLENIEFKMQTKIPIDMISPWDEV